MRAVAAGDAAVLLDLSDASAGGEGDYDPGAAARLAAAVGAAGLHGVLDVIPGARTVLVTVEPGTWDTGQLAKLLLTITPPGSGPAETAPVTEIGVCYDGPDLAAVAALAGLTVAEVITRHQAAEYQVGWLGFAPGFGYLTGLDPALRQIPRLDTPRLAVPAGSVAIAGGLAAVYPARSPGGWRLIGRTDARMWDPERLPPALLAPGRRVRFRAVAELPATGGPPDQAQAAGQQPPGRPLRTRAVEILSPGPLTTIQDAGRPGRGHLGVPRSGAADSSSLRLANALVGNEAGAAGLEVTLGRLGLRLHCDARIAVAGAPVPVHVKLPDEAGYDPPAGSAFAVPAGSAVRLGSPGTGLRSYLAVDGGIDVAPVLGSRSTDLLSGLGPDPLRAGDLLPLGPAGVQASGRELRAARGHESTVPAGPGAEVELRAIAGPRDDWFTIQASEALTRASYQVTAASNRTGLRLTGPQLQRTSKAELPSEGVTIGSLQVSHDGQPILLLADHPTTGGYPVIAVVCAADVDRAAQLRPGQRVRFSLSR
jgi:KipI family sensor histidine kinase inhibitor